MRIYCSGCREQRTHYLLQDSICGKKRHREERERPREQGHPVFECTEKKHLHRADALQIGTVFKENGIMKTKIFILLVVLAVAHVSEADLITVPQFEEYWTEVLYWDVFESDWWFPGPPPYAGQVDDEIATCERTIYPQYDHRWEYSGSFVWEEEDIEYVYRDDLSFIYEVPYWESGIQEAEQRVVSWQWYSYNAEWFLFGDSCSGATVAYESCEVWEAVPEPITLLLLGLGSLGLIRKRRA